MADTNSTASLHAIADATEELLDLIGAAHRRYCKANPVGIRDPFVTRVGFYCALKSLMNAFDVKRVVDDPASLASIEEFIASIQLPVGPASEADEEDAPKHKIAQA